MPKRDGGNPQQEKSEYEEQLAELQQKWEEAEERNQRQNPWHNKLRKDMFM